MPKLDILSKQRGNEYRTFVGIRQKTNMANGCIGCGMCSMVCPNEAIGPVPNTNETGPFSLHNQKGEPYKRGGRRNAEAPRCLTGLCSTASPCSPTRRWMPAGMSST